MPIAIIGTAGRDKAMPMTLGLWKWMLAHAINNVPEHSHVVSGGAAWADHLAVMLFLIGHADRLTMHLPAPLDKQFIGPYKSAASAVNYYHQRFSNVIGEDSLAQIVLATSKDNCDGSYEPIAEGYAAMFTRNAKVAKADEMFAYAFGTGLAPNDGGTKNTWDMCTGKRIYVSLPVIR